MIPQLIGAGLGIAGSIFGASEADKKRKRIAAIAKTPGVDVKGETQATIEDMLSLLSGAESVSRGTAQADQRTLEELLAESIPGYADIQKTRAKSAQDMLEGKLPDDVRQSIERSAAAKSLGGGFSGSGVQRNLTARDLGLTSLDLMGRGQGYAQGIISGTPRANVASAGMFLGPDATQRVGIRGDERTQRMNILLGRENLPTGRGIVGNFLSSVGGFGMGGGFDGMFGGGGAPSGGTSPNFGFGSPMNNKNVFGSGWF